MYVTIRTDTPHMEYVSSFLTAYIPIAVLPVTEVFPPSPMDGFCGRLLQRVMFRVMFRKTKHWTKHAPSGPWSSGRWSDPSTPKTQETLAQSKQPKTDSRHDKGTVAGTGTGLGQRVFFG